MRGFSLIELAIAVFIMALLLGSILVPLQSQIRSRKLDETQRILDQAREALLGYVAALPAQAFLTSTDRRLIEPLAGQETSFFEVAAGTVSPLDS